MVYGLANDHSVLLLNSFGRGGYHVYLTNQGKMY